MLHIVDYDHHPNSVSSSEVKFTWGIYTQALSPDYGSCINLYWNNHWQRSDISNIK